MRASTFNLICRPRLFRLPNDSSHVSFLLMSYHKSSIQNPQNRKLTSLHRPFLAGAYILAIAILAIGDKQRGESGYPGTAHRYISNSEEVENMKAMLLTNLPV